MPSRQIARNGSSRIGTIRAKLTPPVSRGARVSASVSLAAKCARTTSAASGASTAGFLRLPGEVVDEAAQAIQRALRAAGRRRARQQRIEQAEQAFAPLRGRHRLAEHALVAGQHAQQFQQGIERIQRAAFQFRPRRDPAMSSSLPLAWPSSRRSSANCQV
jgi:hypothetical protein